MPSAWTILGMPSMRVGLLNALPPIVSVVAMVFWSRHSDRSGERTWHVVIACVAAAVGLVVAGSASGVIGLIAALTLVNVGISCAKPPLGSVRCSVRRCSHRRRLTARHIDA